MRGKKYFGYFSAFAAYVMWGLLALYWKELGHITAIQQLSIRILMTVVTLGIVLFLWKNKNFLDYLKTPKTRYMLMLTSFLITVNWGVYVYAVAIDQILQASLGYYINPLVSVFLGIFILKEKMNKIQYVSIGLAAVGVMYMTVSYGQFPWISLALAFSFGFYGLFKKTMHLDSMSSLFVEVVFIAPFMLLLLLRTELGLVASGSPVTVILMLLAGVVTIVPLVLFAEGAKRIPLSAVGFLQYIAPTLMLLLGVLKYGEAFTVDHAVSFGFIWAGLILFSVTTLRSEVAMKEAVDVQ